MFSEQFVTERFVAQKGTEDNSYPNRTISIVSITRSYLSNRSQFVCFDGFHSNLLNVSCGVPQGSILGPKLLILYVNDLCNISNLVKYILFADDTNLFCANKNICSGQNVYLICCKQVVPECFENKLHVIW